MEDTYCICLCCESPFFKKNHSCPAGSVLCNKKKQKHFDFCTACEKIIWDWIKVQFRQKQLPPPRLRVEEPKKKQFGEDQED